MRKDISIRSIRFLRTQFHQGLCVHAPIIIPHEKEMELIQKIGIFKGKIRITIDNDDTLTLRQDKLFNKIESRILLDNISPQFDFYKSFSIRAFSISIISLLAAIVLIAASESDIEHANTATQDPFWAFASGLAMVSFFFGVNAYQSRINAVSINNNNGQRLFLIHGNRPSEFEVRKFCEELKSRIERIRYNGEISEERMAAILERHVEFLHEHQVLSVEDKDQAISRIKVRRKSNIVRLATSNIPD